MFFYSNVERKIEPVNIDVDFNKNHNNDID